MSKKGEYETGKSKALRVAIIGCFAVFTVFAMIASLLFGSADISFEVILHTLMGNVQTTDEMVIWNIRFPRNIVGALVGANLAVSGAILQAVMKNPLADPGIVGVSSGAGLAGVIMLIFMPEASLLLTPVAFIGAMLSAAAVYALAWKNGIRPSRIILAGVAVSAFLGSGISALLVFYSDKVQGALLWMVGGLSARSWPQVESLFPYTILGLVFAICGCKALTILSLGDETARGLGLPVEKVRFTMTAVAALLAAGAVSIAGLIGFVGHVRRGRPKQNVAVRRRRNENSFAHGGRRAEDRAVAETGARLIENHIFARTRMHMKRRVADHGGNRIRKKPGTVDHKARLHRTAVGGI